MICKRNQWPPSAGLCSRIDLVAVGVRLLIVVFSTAISRAQVTIEMPQRLEASRTFLSAVNELLPLPQGGLVQKKTQDSTGIVLTNDLVTNPNFNSALLRFPADGYPAGGLVSLGDSLHCVWRLDESGARIDSFMSPAIGTNEVVTSITAQPDGKVIVGGQKIHLGGSGIFDTGLIRLNSDGSIDPTFRGAAYNPKHVIVLPDGRILCLTAGGITRLLPIGAGDTTFRTASRDSVIYCMAVQGDGKILIGGSFTRVDGFSRPGIARLTSEGFLDFDFAPVPGGGVREIKVQKDGRIIVDNSVAVRRFFPDGRLDKTFSVDLNEGVDAIAVDVNDRIYVAENNLVRQFSGRVRVRVAPSEIPLVLERSSAIESGWSAVQSIPANTSGDYIDPNYPGTGNTFFRARPAP